MTRVAAVYVSRTRRIAIAVAVVAALVAVGVVAVRKQLRDGNDFPLYWQAARALVSGRSPYDVLSGLHGYVYLPWFALILAPLGALPLRAAVTCWYALNLLFTWFAGRSSLDAIRAAGLAPSPRLVLLATLPLAGLFHDNLVLGQANLFLLWLLALAARAAVAPSRAGPAREAAAGLAAALKMPAGLLVLPLVFRARWRAVAMFALAAVLAVALPFVVSGPAGGARLLRDWRGKVVAPAAAGTLQGSKIIDQSPHAGLRRVLVAEPAFGDTRVNVGSLSPAAFANVSRALALLLFAGYVLVWLTAPARDTALALLVDLALACCAMVQVAGFNLKAQFVVLLLPAWTSATLAWGGARPRGARAMLVAAGVLFLLSYSDLVGRETANWLLAYSSMALGTLLLAAALVSQRFALVMPSPSAAPAAAPGPGTAP